MRRRARVVSKTAKMVKTIVKRALDKRLENKENCITNTMQIFQNGTTAPVVYFLNPTILQGTSEANRLGNSVHLKNAMLRGYMRLAQTGTGDLNPVIPGQFNVRLFIGRLKTSIVAPSNTDLSFLLRTGASTSPFDSANGLSLCRTVNTELFTIYYDKIHKIGTGGPSQGASSYSTIGGISNNEYKLSKIIKINCTKFWKKNLSFIDNTLNTPSNDALYMWAGIVDSIVSTNSNILPFVEMDFDIEYSYEDA